MIAQGNGSSQTNKNHPCETNLLIKKSQLQLVNCAMNAYFGGHVLPVVFRAFTDTFQGGSKGFLQLRYVHVRAIKQKSFMHLVSDVNNGLAYDKDVKVSFETFL